jgi:hypothetical protein
MKRNTSLLFKTTAWVASCWLLALLLTSCQEDTASIAPVESDQLAELSKKEVAI